MGTFPQTRPRPAFFFDTCRNLKHKEIHDYTHSSHLVRGAGARMPVRKNHTVEPQGTTASCVARWQHIISPSASPSPFTRKRVACCCVPANEIPMNSKQAFRISPSPLRIASNIGASSPRAHPCQISPSPRVPSGETTAPPGSTTEPKTQPRAPKSPQESARRCCPPLQPPPSSP